MTQDPDERAKLSTSRMVATSLLTLAIAVVVSPQISAGGNLQRSLTVTTAVFALLGFGLYLFCFLTSRETVQRSARKVSVRDTLGMLRRNKPLLLLCFAPAPSHRRAAHWSGAPLGARGRRRCPPEGLPDVVGHDLRAEE